ncbi:MAG: hypothetical protein MJ082_01430 [Clostridia bacterium]|nr:hypothetical protein [Clostridia bacterium]
MFVNSLHRDSPAFSGKRVIALGFFDGVHNAHRALIAEAKEKAEAIGAETAVFTFPADGGVKPEAARLSSTEEKLSVLSTLGVERTFLCPLGEIKDMTAEEFADFLTEKLGCTLAVVGYNFRFAKGATADAGTLTDLMRKRGADTLVLPPKQAEDQSLSSSWIRKLLTEGKTAEARELLGVPYTFEGTVEHGRGFGHTFGLPTVNLPIPSGKLIPKSGVYRSLITVEDRGYFAVTDVGTCPSFGERPTHSETFIFGLDGDLYGKAVRVYLLGYLREETVFPEEKALKMQINIDIMKANEANGQEPADLSAVLLRTFKGDYQWQDNGQN